MDCGLDSVQRDDLMGVVGAGLQHAVCVEVGRAAAVAEEPVGCGGLEIGDNVHGVLDGDTEKVGEEEVNEVHLEGGTDRGVFQEEQD